MFISILGWVGLRLTCALQAMKWQMPWQNTPATPSECCIFTVSRLRYTQSPLLETRESTSLELPKKCLFTPDTSITAYTSKKRFNWSSSYSWFSASADKWVMGVKGVSGAAPHFNLAERKCFDCGHQHRLDLTSCVAFCDPFRAFLHQIADAWGPSIAPNVHSWLRGNRPKGEMRNFARTLLPLTLYSALTPDRSSV